jgi:hypothetical protein
MIACGLCNTKNGTTATYCKKCGHRITTGAPKGTDTDKQREFPQPLAEGQLQPLTPPTLSARLSALPGWVYAWLVFFGLLVTLLEGYPWISIHENTSLDPSNPYAQMFSISNEGYVPLTSISVGCYPDFTASNGVVSQDNEFNADNVADYLGHGDQVTVPCFRIPQFFRVTSGASFPNGSTLRVQVRYAFYHLNLPRLRRTQSFRFRSVTANDGSQHWEFLN